MHFLLDNLIATIIAGSIFLILIGINHRNQEAAFESVNFYSLRQQQLAFIDLLKRDMQNVTRLESTKEIDNEFALYVTAPNTSDEHRVVYRRVAVPGADYFRIERMVETSVGIQERQGQSMSTLSGWYIVARNSANQMVNDPDAGTQVYVKFEAAAPYREGKTVKRVRWDAAFRPPMIQPNITL